MRLVLVGWGAIGQEVGRLVADTGSSSGNGAEIGIVGVATRSTRPRVALPPGAVHLTDPAGLAELRPDVVAEAAGRDSVEPWGRSALAVPADYIVSSMSAFTDEKLLALLAGLAAEHRRRLHIHPGALGGIDALAAARAMGIDTVEHRIVKPPAAWLGTPAETLCDLADLVEPIDFFTASAAETAERFPKNANVAMTAALAGIGAQATRVTLVADPTATTNGHRISASGAFGELTVFIRNNPLPGNPKSSAMAALSLARAIINRASAIVV